METAIGADWLIYQDIEDLVRATRTKKSDVGDFECSVFNGNYVTGDVDAAYLTRLESKRNDSARAIPSADDDSGLIDLHNDN